MNEYFVTEAAEVVYTKLKENFRKKAPLSPNMYVEILKLSWSSKDKEKRYETTQLQNLINFLPFELTNDQTTFLVLLSIFHSEMLYGFIEPSIKNTLKKSYWFIFERISSLKKKVIVCNDSYKEIIKFMLSEANRTVIFKSNLMVHLSNCLCYLYGEFLINRVSLIAHDETFVYPNWSLISDTKCFMYELDSYLELVRRQLRVCDILIYTINGVIIILSHLKKSSASPTNSDSIKHFYTILYILERDIQNLINCFSYIMVTAITEFCLENLPYELYQDSWQVWLSFCKPLSLIQTRIQYINDQLKNLLPFDWSFTNSGMVLGLIKPISKHLIDLLINLNNPNLSICDQVNLVQAINASSSQKCLESILSNIPKIPCPLDSFKEFESSLINPNVETVSTNSIIAAFDLDFNEFLIQSRSSLKSFEYSHTPQTTAVYSNNYLDINDVNTHTNDDSSSHSKLHEKEVDDFGKKEKEKEIKALHDTTEKHEKNELHDMSERLEAQEKEKLHDIDESSENQEKKECFDVSVKMKNEGFYQLKEKFSAIRKTKRGNEQQNLERYENNLIDSFEKSIDESLRLSNNHIYDWEISINDLIIEQQIGSGATSTVYKGIWHGTEVAIKKMTSSLLNNTEMQKYKREIQILFKLRHPNLTLFMGASIRKEPYFVVLEFCEGGDLFSLLHIPNSTPHTIHRLSFRQILKIAKDIAKGMAYLHNLSPLVIHRDLKSLNILLCNILRSPYDEPLAKISDFGLSQLREVNGKEVYHTRSSVGTCHWMAPEVLLAKPYNESIDVYSYGILLYELFSYCIPYSSHSNINVAVAVSQGQRPNLYNIPSDIPKSIICLIEACWQQDPQLRPTFPHILNILKTIPS